MNTKQKDNIIPSDYVEGVRALRACDELLRFLGPVLQGTRREGDSQGVIFLTGLIADLGALREGLHDTISG